MIHRLNNIPLDEKYYKGKLNTIKYLAESNGYNRTIVNKLLHKTNNSHRILYWHRYVDDILILYRGNKRQDVNSY